MSLLIAAAVIGTVLIVAIFLGLPPLELFAASLLLFACYSTWQALTGSQIEDESRPGRPY
ncbi:MAG: hypothetical protein K2X29_08670 [Candidatus Obscuribacterales bacterium]|nr:hypothetical protein [Candidatus Obscuribacterales bacterium]